MGKAASPNKESHSEIELRIKRGGTSEAKKKDIDPYSCCFLRDLKYIWTRTVQADGFFVPDIIGNTDGSLTILGMMASNYPSSIFDGFPENDTEEA